MLTDICVRNSDYEVLLESKEIDDFFNKTGIDFNTFIAIDFEVGDELVIEYQSYLIERITFTFFGTDNMRLNLWVQKKAR